MLNCGCNWTDCIARTVDFGDDSVEVACPKRFEMLTSKTRSLEEDANVRLGGIGDRGEEAPV